MCSTTIALCTNEYNNKCLDFENSTSKNRKKYRQRVLRSKPSTVISTNAADTRSQRRRRRRRGRLAKCRLGRRRRQCPSGDCRSTGRRARYSRRGRLAKCRLARRVYRPAAPLRFIRAARVYPPQGSQTPAAGHGRRLRNRV